MRSSKIKIIFAGFLIFFAGVVIAQGYFFINQGLRISYGRTEDVENTVPNQTPNRSPSLTPAPTSKPFSEGYLLPDMQISVPEQLYINDEEGVKKIRFDTAFKNIGRGPLELIGETNHSIGKTIATQVIQRVDGTTESTKVGEFVYHPGPDHDHWHVDKYAQFQLWKYDSNGKKSELVASTDKFSFCIWDEYPVDKTLEGAPVTRQYPRCPDNIQGNSVGWGDTYPAHLEGQELDITGVEDGSYLVRSTINADQSFIESDYSNNSAELYVTIDGYDITVDSHPQVKGWWIKRFFVD